MFTLKFDKFLTILDQTQLPNKEVYLTLTKASEVREAIVSLRVRGAPAIGIAAAYGFCLGLEEGYDKQELAEYLNSARPTAVNLSWAIKRMLAADDPLAEARAIEAEDRACCLAIGEHGLALLKPGMGVLTHCNAGALAVSAYGTALAPLYRANELGYGLKIYADETRPLLQGARLTAYELHKSGADVTVICDNMAAFIMKQGVIDAVFVGADRIAKNGDFANKVGTLSVAIAAKHFGIPFYVCAPTSTFDPDCEKGENIEIEERSAEEVTSMWYKEPMAPAGVKVRNPAFDITDGGLVTAFVTEKGVLRL